jgi:lysophospholipase L1-like esterase
MKFLFKKIYYFIFIALVSYVIIEATCYVFLKTGYIKSNLPTFQFSFKAKDYPYQIADIHPVWGTWHYAETYNFNGDCFNVPYNINSYGARDKERTVKSIDSNRVLVLGDSFIEGFGIEEKDRLSNILEAETGTEFLNFGCSDFGTAQEYLLYKNLALKFTHSTILLSILPMNDFYDNDINYHKGLYDGYVRYKPYYIKDSGKYNLVYADSNFQNSTFNKEGYFKKNNSVKGTLARFLRAYTAWFNVLDYFRHVKKRSTYYSQNYSGFVNYKKSDIERLSYLIKEIKSLAQNKRFIVFTIPIESEIKRYQQDGQNPLAGELLKLCKENKVEFIDLLPLYAGKQIKDYFLPCNPHWNSEGNKFAAEILKPLFDSTKNFTQQTN